MDPGRARASCRQPLPAQRVSRYVWRPGGGSGGFSSCAAAVHIKQVNAACWPGYFYTTTRALARQYSEQHVFAHSATFRSASLDIPVSCRHINDGPGDFERGLRCCNCYRGDHTSCDPRNHGIASVLFRQHSNRGEGFHVERRTPVNGRFSQTR
jgi:hypothetical protein